MSQLELFAEVFPEWQGGPPLGERKQLIAPKPVVEAVSNERDHAERILALLRLRPASSLELSKIALKYTSRISDLRKAGHVIDCRKTKSEATGKTIHMYYLEEPA